MLNQDPAQKGSVGRGIALSLRGSGPGLLGFREHFRRPTDMAFLDPVSVVCWGGPGRLDVSETKPAELADGALGFGRSGHRTFSLCLHADGIFDQSSHELGIHQHEGGFFLCH